MPGKTNRLETYTEEVGAGPQPCCFRSDDRSAEVFQKRIDTATQMKSVLGANERPNCLIIDEIDGAPAVNPGHAGEEQQMSNGCASNCIVCFSSSPRLPSTSC